MNYSCTLEYFMGPLSNLSELSLVLCLHSGRNANFKYLAGQVKSVILRPRKKYCLNPVTV